MEVYLVGGAVRDELLGLPVTERDYVVVGATPEDMAVLGFKPVGKQFPVFLHPNTKEEYALARTEKKIARGYHGFSFNADPNVTLEQDLSRRDLTINAIAKSVSGELIDPYGGIQDIERRVLRHVSKAFVEDPVRVLRIARFAARYKSLGFTIAPETMELMIAIRRAGELDSLVPERVWQETWKALQEPNPEEYFQVLRGCGALAILFPEIEALFGVPCVIEQKHYMDSGISALLALQQAVKLSDAPEVRFAALVHCLGKGLMPPESWPQLEGYEAYSVQPLQTLADRYKISRQVKEIAIAVAKYHDFFGKKLSPEEILVFLDGCDAFRRTERFEQIILACEACYFTQDKTEIRTFFLELLPYLRYQLKQLDPKIVSKTGNLQQFYQQKKLHLIKQVLSQK